MDANVDPLSHLLTSTLWCSLKLNFYRSLGISATQDPQTEEFNRAVVRRARSPESEDGAEKPDVSVINVADGKLGRNFYTSMFWDAM